MAAVSAAKYDGLRFCGVNFWTDSVDALIDSLRANGGYVVVPSAPSFATLLRDKDCESALTEADYAIVDSGLMAIAFKVLFRKNVHRISGLKLLQSLLIYDTDWVASSKILWVAPSSAEAERIRSYLDIRSFDVGKSHFYEAPLYGCDEDFSDCLLATKIRETAPDLIVLCIGGDKQERLAHRMRDEFGIRVPTICTGAAIAFLTGGQARIPTWVDRCYLGWLARIVQQPSRFLPRYLSAAFSFPQVIVHHFATR